MRFVLIHNRASVGQSSALRIGKVLRESPLGPRPERDLGGEFEGSLRGGFFTVITISLGSLSGVLWAIPQTPGVIGDRSNRPSVNFVRDLFAVLNTGAMCGLLARRDVQAPQASKGFAADAIFTVLVVVGGFLTFNAYRPERSRSNPHLDTNNGCHSSIGPFPPFP